MESSLAPDTLTNSQATCDDSFDSTENDAASEIANSEPCECGAYEAGDEYNRHLQLRILHLRDTIQVLKKQLRDEREIWRREMDERRESDYISRATEIGYYYTDPAVSAGLSMGIAGGLEAELMAKYSDNFLQSHYEHRQNLQKQIAMANYKRRLLEVENMCNLELLRVKQSVQILQPLQMMCSEWRFPGEGGDGVSREALKAVDVTDEEKLKHRPAEVSMPLEMIAQKVEDDMNLLMSETVPLEMSRSQPNLSD